MKHLALLCLAACTGNVDPAWELDHDRVIAVKMEPPRLQPGESSTMTALIGHKGAPPDEQAPITAVVDSPSGLASALAQTSTGWTVTAPPDADLAAARTELGLASSDPVPLRVKLTFPTNDPVAYKIVWLSDSAANPVIDPITIDGMDALMETSLTVAAQTKIPAVVAFDETYDINWLTSCGTMHDFDLAKAYLKVEPGDSQSGTFAVVVRDLRGGVAWHLWPITAE
ncbi:hypothetical protein BH11MYX1_BH11MYX1_31460 [soil metagenome]